MQATQQKTQSRWQAWRSKNSNRQTFEAWVILIPILLYYLLFNVVPILLNIFVSFTEWRGVYQPPQFVGFDNYLRYLQAPYPLIFFNTIFFAVTTLIIQTVLAFFIAVALNQKLMNRGLYRALWYIPTLTSAAIMSQIALIFISPFDGVIKSILDSMGIVLGLPLTLNVTFMRTFIILFTVWRGVGVPIVLYLAALQGIHKELYSAAQVDGANGWQTLRHITAPLLKPMTIFILVTGIINGFQIFEASLLISKGGPNNSTNVMLLQIYNDAFTNFNLGVASAGSVILAVTLLWFSITGLRLMNSETG